MPPRRRGRGRGGARAPSPIRNTLKDIGYDDKWKTSFNDHPSFDSKFGLFPILEREKIPKMKKIQDLEIEALKLYRISIFEGKKQLLYMNQQGHTQTALLYRDMMKAKAEKNVKTIWDDADSLDRYKFFVPDELLRGAKPGGSSSRNIPSSKRKKLMDGSATKMKISEKIDGKPVSELQDFDLYDTYDGLDNDDDPEFHDSAEEEDEENKEKDEKKQKGENADEDEVEEEEVEEDDGDYGENLVFDDDDDYDDMDSNNDEAVL